MTKGRVIELLWKLRNDYLDEVETTSQMENVIKNTIKFIEEECAEPFPNDRRRGA